jgi:ParB family chromosome partitioning protein
MKSRLGKGLDELFTENYFSESNGEASLEVELSKVVANPYQPRKHFDEVQLKELAESLKTHGVISPILVTIRNGKFVLVAGERRFRAAQLAGFVTIPAFVREYTDNEMLEIALLENIQREDLTPMEVAKTYEIMIHQLGVTQQQLALRVGKSRSQITNMIGLLSLPAFVQEYVNNGKLSMGHARALSKLQDRSLIEELTKRIVKDNLSVRDIEQIAQSKAKKTPIKARNVVRYVSEQKRLIKKFGPKVTIRAGVIQFRFKDDKELVEILEKLDA